METEPVLRCAREAQKLRDYRCASKCVVVATNIVAVAEVSPQHHHAVYPAKERLENKPRVNPPGAHYADVPDVRGILEARDSGEVGAGVRAPVAAKGKYLGLEVSHQSLLQTARAGTFINMRKLCQRRTGNFPPQRLNRAAMEKVSPLSARFLRLKMVGTPPDSVKY